MKQSENKIAGHLFIPFKEYVGKIGGPSTFMQNLEGYLKEKQLNYYSNLRHLKKAKGIFSLYHLINISWIFLNKTVFR